MDIVVWKWLFLFLTFSIDKKLITINGSHPGMECLIQEWEMSAISIANDTSLSISDT